MGRNITVVAITLFLALNYLWELAHSGLYRFSPALPVRVFLVLCTLGDLALGALTYILVAMVFRQRRWLLGKRWVIPTVTWVAFGVALTGLFELFALERGLWTYKQEMPTILGVGLSPTLQWLTLPATVAVAVRILVSHQDCRP